MNGATAERQRGRAVSPGEHDNGVGGGGVHDPVIAAHALALGYRGDPVLRGLRFEVAPGRRLAVLGPNGGGKTTLLRAIAGELRPQAGSLDVACRVGVVPQREHCRLDYPVSALDVAVMGSLPRLRFWERPGRAQRHWAHRALGQVGLDELAQTTFGELSGGQRQRVLIARALVQGAGVLLLDEPFNGLDVESAGRLEALIVELCGRGTAVVIATHDLDQTRVADLVLCLNRRQVAFGPPAEVLTRWALEATYGAEIVELPGDGSQVLLPPHQCQAEGA